MRRGSVYTARFIVELYLNRIECRSTVAGPAAAFDTRPVLARPHAGRRARSRTAVEFEPRRGRGYLSVTVPAGWVHGLPIGLSFFGPAWSKPVLLRLASAFEQAIQARAKPGFAETLAGR